MTSEIDSDYESYDPIYSSFHSNTLEDRNLGAGFIAPCIPKRKIYHKRIFGKAAYKIIFKECDKCQIEGNKSRRCYIVQELNRTFRRCAKRSTKGLNVYVYMHRKKRHF